MTVMIRMAGGNLGTTPRGKVADAELVFTEGPLAGLKLIGFGIWQRTGGGLNVTFPARQYSVNGERRSFVLLRQAEFKAGSGVGISDDQARVRDLIIAAYENAQKGVQA